MGGGGEESAAEEMEYGFWRGGGAEDEVVCFGGPAALEDGTGG